MIRSCCLSQFKTRQEKLKRRAISQQNAPILVEKAESAKKDRIKNKRIKIKWKKLIRGRVCSFRKRLAVCDSIRQKHRALASRRKEKDKTSRHRGHSRLHREVNREAAPLAGRPGADDQRTHDSVRSLRFEVWPSLCRLPP